MPRLKTVAELEMEALLLRAGVVPPDAQGGDAATQTAPDGQDTDSDDTEVPREELRRLVRRSKRRRQRGQ